MANPGRSKILIVDDHPIVRLGLAQVINHEPDLEVCGEAAAVLDAMRQIEAQRPDVVIIDISLEGESGMELIEHIRARWPHVKMLVSSAHDEEVFAGRVLRAGALGYLSKREAIAKVVEAIRRVLRGEVYLEGATASKLLQRAAAGKTLDGDPTQSLSNRELQVFELIGRGLSTRQIARQMDVSPKTVESHRLVIKTKLNAATSAQLAQMAFQWVQENH